MIPRIDKIFSGKLRKKGSLSLSINAIVVLVLAIAMLGLGLAFTKGMFKKFGEKLTVPPPDIPATAEEPIVLPAEEIEIQHGKDAVFQVNFYNDHNTGTVDSAVECYGTLASRIMTFNICDPSVYDCTALEAANEIVIAAPQRVEAGTYKSFKFIIPKHATAATASIGQDVCEVKFCAPDTSGVGSFLGSGCMDEFEKTKQIVIKVK